MLLLPIRDHYALATIVVKTIRRVDEYTKQILQSNQRIRLTLNRRDERQRLQAADDVARLGEPAPTIRARDPK